MQGGDGVMASVDLDNEDLRMLRDQQQMLAKVACPSRPMRCPVLTHATPLPGARDPAEIRGEDGGGGGAPEVACPCRAAQCPGTDIVCEGGQADASCAESLHSKANTVPFCRCSDFCWNYTTKSPAPHPERSLSPAPRPCHLSARAGTACPSGSGAVEAGAPAGHLRYLTSRPLRDFRC